MTNREIRNSEKMEVAKKENKLQHKSYSLKLPRRIKIA